MDKRSKHFFVACNVPTRTHQQKSIRVVKNKPVVYEDAELKAVRLKYTAYLAREAPVTPFRAPIELRLVWYYHTNVDSREGTLKTTKPDVGNDFKLLLDVMQDLGYWADDAHISVIHNTKMWTTGRGGIEVCIQEI